ncbi:MAG: ComF family protein [Anaerolineae bacterium]|nr:ComF family protein [Anaerolineae bacterium]
MPGKQLNYDDYQEAQDATGLLASYSRPWKNWLQWGLELLFPPRCVGCGRVDTNWCTQCQQELDRQPVDEAIRQHPPLEAVATTAVHEDIIQRLIWNLKYENGVVLANPLAERMTTRLQALNWTFDMIVPVPLHTIRLSERGYNQSQILAENIAQQLDKPCCVTALSRQRYTQAQVGLNAQERQVNMQAAFTADPQVVANQTLLLIDDVFTTGATLGACAQAAVNAGAQAVYGLTLSSARA